MAMPTARRLPLLATSLALAGVVIVVGCSGAASPSPSAPPSASGPPAASPTPDPESVDYPTGADDVVLRYDEGGGMMVVEWSLASAPVFTLYGDGTVVFRDPMDAAPPTESGVFVNPPFKTAKLSPEQIDALLEFAITEGGLAAARDRYDNPMLADVGNSVFTINAGGRSKEVTVTGLFESDATAPDAISRTQFRALAERLRSFDNAGTVPTAEYKPQQWRVHLIEGAPMDPAAVNPWPWEDLTPEDFAAEGSFPYRIMSAEDVGRLEVDGAAGGFTGYYVEGPDGKTYSVVVRPLLPGDEAE
jgi:hypothetical protein